MTGSATAKLTAATGSVETRIGRKPVQGQDVAMSISCTTPSMPPSSVVPNAANCLVIDASGGYDVGGKPGEAIG